MYTEKICSKKIVFPKKFMVAGREGIVRDFGKVMYTLLYLKAETLKNKADITLPTKLYRVKAMVFLVFMYRCESWTIKKV